MDKVLHLPVIDESTHTTNRMSARNPRMEIIMRGERRRSWTADQKSQIVAESLGPELTPTEVARKHGISTGLLYTWRQQRLSVQTALVTRAAPRFAEVELTGCIVAGRGSRSEACWGACAITCVSIVAA